TINVGSCGRLTIHADTITIDATSTIDATGKACDTRGKGGNGNHVYDGGGGGGHSANGGAGYNYSSTSQPGGPAFGSRYELSADLGGCGGNGGNNSNAGRQGGGVIELY